MSELKPRVAALAARVRPPGLAVVLAGHDPGSEIYVRNKVRACQELGIRSETLTPPDSVTTEELLGMVAELNARPEVDGILVQLPLPPRVDAKRVVAAIAPAKDVDGLHPCNIGNLVKGVAGPRACTPAGILNCSSGTALASRAGARWWWAAAISWASRWPFCCSTSTPP